MLAWREYLVERIVHADWADKPAAERFARERWNEPHTQLSRGRE